MTIKSLVGPLGAWPRRRNECFFRRSTIALAAVAGAASASAAASAVASIAAVAAASAAGGSAAIVAGTSSRASVRVGLAVGVGELLLAVIAADYA